MRAELPEFEVNNAKNLDQDKERIDTLRAVGMIKGELRTVVEARFYMARRSDGASPVYCSLWVHCAEGGTSGYGRANGYGYHKQSAALSAAIDSAGIKLFGDQYERDTSPEREAQPARIDGCGSNAMRAAVTAIMLAAGAPAQPSLVE